MNKKLLGVAVGLAMGISTQMAQAESLLFPYFQSGNGAISFLSLRSDHDRGLHYVLQTAANAATPSGPCASFSYTGHITAMDLLQQTVQAPADSGLDLPLSFGELVVDQGTGLIVAASNGDRAVAPGGDLTHQFYPPAGGVLPAVGFLTVSTTGVHSASTPSLDDEGNFNGSMDVIDAANGIFFGYKGVNNPTSAVEGDFHHAVNGHVIFDFTWYPDTFDTGPGSNNVGGATDPGLDINTEWYTLVTGLAMDEDINAGWVGSGSYDNFTGLVWDRHEAPVDGGSPPVAVSCLLRSHRTAHMTAGAARHTIMGGHIRLLFTPNVATRATGALVYKIINTSILNGAPLTIIESENAIPNTPF